MRISTRIRLSAVFAVIIAATAGVALLVGLQAVNAAIGRGSEVTESLNDTFELSMLTTDYLINYEPRAERQWHAKQDKLSSVLAGLEVTSDADAALVASMNEDLEQAHTAFTDIALAHQKRLADEIPADVAFELESRLTSRLLVLMQSIVSDAVVLAHRSSDAAQSAEQLTITVVLLVSGIGVLTMIVIGISADRAIITPLVELRKAASRVGRGNLDVRSGIVRGDEVGEFAVAFDGMVTSLQESYVMLQNEIGERRRAEEALHEYKDHLEQTVQERTSELIVLNEDLQRATRAKDDFLASMSHELRTPLNSVIGFTDLMLKGRTGELNDEQRRQIHMVNQAGKQLLSLVNDVLELSRIDAGAAPVIAAPFDSCDAVHRLVEMMTPAAEAKSLSLTYESAEGLPAGIVSDRGKVDQIMLNLIANAIKFTPEGSVTVTVRPAGPEMIAYDVRDTGIGIPTEETERIFEHFHQVQAGPLSEAGTGLGLAISRRLTEVLGGRLTVTSEVGEGSTFTLELPVGHVGAEAGK